jgi:uncharacterized protein (UPF0276 family)
VPEGKATNGLFPDLGQGLGLRPQHYAHVLKHLPPVAWFEIISENFMGLTNESAMNADHVPEKHAHTLALGGRPLENLDKIREHYPIACHGVSLSIGSVDPLDYKYLKNLKIFVDRIQPANVSDHLCWTGVQGENLHDLLPLPYTEEAIQHVVSRIIQVQEFLGRRILIENVSSYLTFKQSEMEEWEFLNEICQRADCGILLDINNIFVSAQNHKYDAKKYLEFIDPARVGQFHLAGHSDMGSYLIDTHDQPVTGGVWDLYKHAVKRFGSVSTMIERDGNIPEFDELLAESNTALQIQESVLGKKSSAPSKLASLGHHSPERGFVSPK